MTNVIDRLRVQGSAAPRHLYSHPDSGLRGSGRGRGGGEEKALPQDQDGVQFVLNHAHLQNRDTNSGGKRLNQTARRLEHLQRVQQANQGLSTMDARQPGLRSKQFMLRGKPASADVALQHLHHPHQGWANSSVGSGKSGRKLRFSKTQGDPGNGILPRVRNEIRGSARSTETHDVSNNSYPTSAGATQVSTATSYFVHANSGTLDQAPVRSVHSDSRGRGGQQVIPGSRSGVMARRQATDLRSAGSTATFELTGHQVVTPRSTTYNDDGLSSRDYYTRSPRHGRHGFKDRRSPYLKDASSTEQIDTQSLRQCLHVQPTSSSEPPSDLALRARHMQPLKGLDPQGGRGEAKINYNNPYRQTRPKERQALPESARRYIFDSVASYIHFNKIYPHMRDDGGCGTNRSSPLKGGGGGGKGGGVGGVGGGKDRFSKVPHLAGFPNHCTDTILLRMMFEMNRPGAVHGIGLGHQAAGAPSVRSSNSNKYSDVGRQRDLDEANRSKLSGKYYQPHSQRNLGKFLVQGETPSTLNSQRQPLQQQTTHRSNVSAGFHTFATPPQEADEEGRRSWTAPGASQGGGDRKAGWPGGGDQAARIAEAEEDDSTLRTATTPGRNIPGDEDGNFADDEASQWNSVSAAPPRAKPPVVVGVAGGGGGDVDGGGDDDDGGHGDDDEGGSDSDTTVDTNRQP